MLLVTSAYNRNAASRENAIRGSGLPKPGTAICVRSRRVRTAHLGPYGRDSALRRRGVKLAERGAEGSKRKAVVAVAHKLAVLLHRLWLSRRRFEPFHGSVAAA